MVHVWPLFGLRVEAGPLSLSPVSDHYAVTRSCETGSWLGRRHQDKGIGTLLRQTMCAFAFDHLQAREVTSSAWTDNAASLAVSAKVGYTENGQRRQVRRTGELATMQHLVLTPSRLVRHEFSLAVHGLGAVQEFLGIEKAQPASSNETH